MTEAWVEADDTLWSGLAPETAASLRKEVFRTRSEAARRHGWAAALAARLFVSIRDGQPRFAIAGAQ